MFKIADIFTDHMVLQREQNIKVFGKCDEQGEIKGLKERSTLVIEARTTLAHSQLSEPIGYFNTDNWNKAAAGLLYQTPQIKMAFDAGVHHTGLFNHLFAAR